MKGSGNRTKAVVRHLPPTILQSAFSEQIDGRFGGRYSWLSFRSGKPSQKHQPYAKAYIDFTKPEDVVEFAEFFNGHVFVNEKGTQFKAVVEYAPCQRVPKQCSKKDVREGTIVKDPDYLEFLEAISKPVGNLPSAEIQLDRRDAEKAGAGKDVPIVTPLMDFVRQKRAAKCGSRRILSNGRSIRKAAGALGSPISASSRRGSEKRRVSTTMYILRDSSRSASGKDKSTGSLAPEREDQPLPDKSVSVAAAPGNEASEAACVVPGSANMGKKILLLKGKEKEKENPQVSDSLSLQQSGTLKSIAGSTTLRENRHRESSGRIIRSILLNKDARQFQTSSAVRPGQQIDASNQGKDRRPPRPQSLKSSVKGTNSEEMFFWNDMHDLPRDKQEKRIRNKDRPDRGVWTPIRSSDGSHASDESLSLLNSQGLHKNAGRKGLARDGKDSDGSFTVSEGKTLKRGGSGYTSFEKQVWVQKSSAGS